MLIGSRAARFEPYRNDRVASSYIEKLSTWLSQFEPDEQPSAFLLAASIIFVTERQFNSLLRTLYRVHIRRAILDAVIHSQRLPPFDYLAATGSVDDELEATLIVGNSDSSPVNAFKHVNIDEWPNYQAQRLFGPTGLWSYQAAPRASATRPARTWTDMVLSVPAVTAGKRRLIILEDFSGSGSDLTGTIQALEASAHAFHEIHIAAAIATEHAVTTLNAEAAAYTRRTGVPCRVHVSLTLPHAVRCFGGPTGSYLDDVRGVPALSVKVNAVSERVYTAKFAATLPREARHGLGELALAFVTFANCPDNSLPILWVSKSNWRPLFRRASRYL